MLNIIMICVTMLIIMCVGLFYHRLTKITPEESWAAAIMSILILIYIAGLFGNTQWGLFVIYGIAIAGLVMGIVGVVKKSEYSLISYLTPGIVFIFGVAIVGSVAFRGMLITNWDELYQWGKAADFMMEYNQFPAGEEFSGESLLLTTTTFFHYFMAKLSMWVQGSITESNYYVSNLVLWCSALILPFAGEGWKLWKRVWFFGIFQFLFAAMIFVQPYYNIYTDQPTAYWAGSVIAWMALGKCTRKNVFLIPLILINVGLMKSMVGPMFAVIVIIAAISIYCTKRVECGKRIIPKDWKRILFSKKGMIGCGIVLSPVIFVGIWSVVSGENGLFRYNGGMTNQGEENRLQLTIKSMLQKIFVAVNQHEEHIYISYVLFAVIVIGLVYILYPLILEKKHRFAYTNLMKIYILGFVGYFFVMLFAYMVVFGYTDSVRAMSLERYYSDYIMLGVVPLFIPLFIYSETEKERLVSLIKRSTVALATLFVVCGISDYFLPQFAHIYAVEEKKYAEREQFIEYAEDVKKYTQEQGKVYFINQEKSGLFTLVADYELGEQISRGGMCYKFREDTSETILGLTDYPIEQFPTILIEQGYEYVWIYSSDTYLEENMNELFDLKNVKNGNFYKVICGEDGSVVLDYVGRVK